MQFFSHVFEDIYHTTYHFPLFHLNSFFLLFVWHSIKHGGFPQMPSSWQPLAFQNEAMKHSRSMSLGVTCQLVGSKYPGEPFPWCDYPAPQKHPLPYSWSSFRNSGTGLVFLNVPDVSPEPRHPSLPGTPSHSPISLENIQISVLQCR